MRHELKEIKRRIDALVSVLPELDAVTRKLKDAGFANEVEKPIADGPAFVFSLGLTPAYREDGKLFGLSINCPETCDSFDLTDRLFAYGCRIELFELLAEELQKRGVAFRTVTVNRLPEQCIYAYLATASGTELELELFLDEAVFIQLTIRSPEGDELYVEFDKIGWSINREGIIDDRGTLAQLGQTLAESDPKSTEGQAKILDAIAAHYLAPKPSKPPRRKMPWHKT
jgi:hypothetical protein